MFTTEDIIGDVVYIAFRDSDRYTDLGITETSGHFHVQGYDGFGVWVSHPGLVIVHSKNKKSNQDKSKNEGIEANFMISWDNIKTIMHYPNRKGYDFPSEFDINIGFKTKKNKNL